MPKNFFFSDLERMADRLFWFVLYKNPVVTYDTGSLDGVLQGSFGVFDNEMYFLARIKTVRVLEGELDIGPYMQAYVMNLEYADDAVVIGRARECDLESAAIEDETALVRLELTDPAIFPEKIPRDSSMHTALMRRTVYR